MPNKQKRRQHNIQLAKELAAELGEPIIGNEHLMQAKLTAQAATAGPVQEETSELAGIAQDSDDPTGIAQDSDDPTGIASNDIPANDPTPFVESLRTELAELDDAASAAVDIAAGNAIPESETDTVDLETTPTEAQLIKDENYATQSLSFLELSPVLKTPEEEAASFLRFTSGHFASLLHDSRNAPQPTPESIEQQIDPTEDEVTSSSHTNETEAQANEEMDKEFPSHTNETDTNETEDANNEPTYQDGE